MDVGQEDVGEESARQGLGLLGRRAGGDVVVTLQSADQHGSDPWLLVFNDEDLGSECFGDHGAAPRNRCANL
jgi:hypothetical protein